MGYGRNEVENVRLSFGINRANLPPEDETYATVVRSNPSVILCEHFVSYLHERAISLANLRE